MKKIVISFTRRGDIFSQHCLAHLSLLKKYIIKIRHQYILGPGQLKCFWKLD